MSLEEKVTAMAWELYVADPEAGFAQAFARAATWELTAPSNATLALAQAAKDCRQAQDDDT